jgi:cyclophilin family peptidyl-prolyl cis-trans isomerase
MPNQNPEQIARDNIDKQLADCGWIIQDMRKVNLFVGIGVAVDLEPEFNNTPHDLGILSMARTADPASANTSFFIVTARVSALDGQYTVFGRVVEGLDVVQQIEMTPVDGETPVTRVEVGRVTVIAP